jgi:hypothetical protein
MIGVYLADARPEERSTLRVLLFDLKMEVVGEATNWSTTLWTPIGKGNSRFNMIR